MLSGLLLMIGKAPTFLKVGAGCLVVLLSMKVYYSFKIKAEQRRTAVAIGERDSARAEVVDVKSALADAQRVNADFAVAAEKQNATIATWKSRAEAAETRASLDALRALKAGTETAAELRSPETIVPPGHDAMNQWFADAFRAP